jgi:hypothetical protein
MAEHAATASGGVGHQRDEGGAQWSAELSVLEGWWVEGCIEGVTG